jgi:hypothetical protein
MTDAVATPSPEYNQMSPKWALTATLRAGTEAMRAAGKTYLPQEADEQPKSYENRLRRSVLTNMYRKTADKLIGKPLKKPIIVEEDVPQEIKALLDDIDSLGTRLDVFAKEVFQQAVDDGLTHILVEYPDSDKAAREMGEFINDDGTRSLSLRQATELGIRPYARHIKAADLIGWKWEIIEGRKTLTQIRIYEIGRVEGETEFDQELRERVRVIERDNWRLYEKQEATGASGKKRQEWVIIEEGKNTLGKIALSTLYTNQTGFMMGEPWLDDIAQLNVAHWQSDSDQRNLLHVARVPILFAKGFGDEDTQLQLSIGSSSFLKGPSSADLKYVEHSGKGIEAGRNDLKDIEERIQFLGLEAMMKRPGGGGVTATQSAIDSSEANSSLGMISQELENTLEEMLDYFASWMEMPEDSGGSLTVFKDFGIEMADSADIDMLLKAKQAGEISQLTFLKEIKRRGLLAEDFDPQTEIDLLDIESGGKATTDDPIDPMDEEMPEPKHKGRNAVGDVTAEVDGHRHTLEENGKMSSEQDSEGTTHTHTWDEFSIRTSVDDGHSHVLLGRAAETKGDSPAIPPPGNGEEIPKDSPIPPADGGNKAPPVAPKEEDD